MKTVALLLGFMLALAAAASAEITLLTPENGVHSSTNPQQFAFTITEQPSNCSLNLDGSPVKTVHSVNANQTALITYELLNREYGWSVSCSTASGTASSQQYVIVMDTAAPSVALQKPVAGARINTTTAKFVYTPHDSNLKSCSLRLKINDKWSTLQNNLSTPSGKNNSFSIELIDGAYEWNVRCFDHANNSGAALFDRGLTIDTTPPKIVSYTPFSVITESSATLTVNTNEEATCRYSKSPNTTYSDMSQFELTERLAHRQFLSDVDDGINTYYVKCVDMLNNGMQEEKVKLDVHLLATAEVSLSKPAPVSAGKVDVTLVTSRDLIEPPELSYSFDAGNKIAIPLTGEDSEWKGSFIIEDVPQKRIGIFHFKGKDIYGYDGSIITEGKTFLVDTEVPGTVSNLKGKLESNRPVLTWSSVEDDILTYEVYRSASNGVTLSDFYANTSSTTFTDNSVESRQTYYYRVAIVDRANNRGELSDEIFVSVIPDSEEAEPAEEEAEEAKPLPPKLVLKVNDAIKGIEAEKFAVAEAKARLESLTGETRKVADDLNLITKAENAGIKLDSLVSNLEQLKSAYHSESEVGSQVSKADLETKKIVATLVQNVAIAEQTEFVQDVSKDDVLRAASELSSQIGINKENKNAYVDHNMRIIQDIKISTKITVVGVEFVNGKTDRRTLFQKSLSHKGEKPLEDVVVIEFVPKTVAESTSGMDFVSDIPEIINDDPVLKWGFVELGFDPQPIKYLVNREVSITDAKDTVAVPLASLDVLAGQTKVTGFATYSLSKGSSLMVLLIIATIVMLGYYYFRPASGGQQGVKDPVSYELLTDINHKLTSMKMELDDMTGPLMGRINASLEQRHDVSGLELTQKFVEIASRYADMGEMQKARDLYHTITLLYQQLPKEQKSGVHSECMKLAEKLR